MKYIGKDSGTERVRTKLISECVYLEKIKHVMSASICKGMELSVRIYIKGNHGSKIPTGKLKPLI